MRRLVQTSAGPVVVDLDRVVGTDTYTYVSVLRFGGDGWEAGYEKWLETMERQQPPRTLAKFLEAELPLPPEEAEVLAKDILGPWMETWRARGGERDVRWAVRATVVFVVALATLILLAALAVGLVIWLLVS